MITFIETKMIMQEWRSDKDKDKENSEYWVQNRSQCHFAQHKSPVYWPGIEPESPW